MTDLAVSSARSSDISEGWDRRANRDANMSAALVV
jgi:hypothetical protein